MTRVLYAPGMSTSTKNNTQSRSERRRTRAEMRDSFPAMVLSLAAFGVLVLVDPDGLTPLNVVWAALSIASVLGFVWAQVRSLRRADEYQRIVRLEAIAIGFGTVIVLSFTAGMLNALGVGEPRQFYEPVFIVGVVVWAAAHEIKSRRAR